MKPVKIDLSVSELIHMVACLKFPMAEVVRTGTIMSYTYMMISNARLACALIDEKFPDLKETIEVVE